MRPPLLRSLLAAAALAVPSLRAEPVPAAIARQLGADLPALLALYEDLHAHPELSLKEEKTAAHLAAELRAAGFEVTEHFGGTGVVAVLRNGPGPTLYIRSDMDALPVHEETGLPYASTVRSTDLSGREVPVMHACGHDLHMTVLTGTARMLVALKDRWSGTVVLLGQPAEEMVVGARNMLSAGLYRVFPKPDFVIGLHDDPNYPVGTVGFSAGYFTSNADGVDIVVHGIGGHGARPETTKDPVVVAAQIVLALQTIVSREIKPGQFAVVTVGAIHGGTKRNIIPNDVTLNLTVRSYSDDVRARLLASIKRIARGEAMAAGLPEELLPTVTVLPNEAADSTYNDPALTKRVRAAAAALLGAERVVDAEPQAGSEDFSQFGRTVEKVPLCFFVLGATAPERLAESRRSGIPLPSLHSSKFYPIPEPAIKTGVSAFTAATLDLLPKT
jgi:amidohydrolase